MAHTVVPAAAGRREAVASAGIQADGSAPVAASHFSAERAPQCPGVEWPPDQWD